MPAEEGECEPEYEIFVRFSVELQVLLIIETPEASEDPVLEAGAPGACDNRRGNEQYHIVRSLRFESFCEAI